MMKSFSIRECERLAMIVRVVILLPLKLFSLIIWTTWSQCRGKVFPASLRYFPS